MAGTPRDPGEAGVSCVALAGAGHWAVIVPFMSGWTSQMKV
jgi:hypothetical protein